jgi:hypothetical protein
MQVMKEKPYKTNQKLYRGGETPQAMFYREL